MMMSLHFNAFYQRYTHVKHVLRLYGVFSALIGFLQPQITDFLILSYHNKKLIDPYDWFCAPGSHFKHYAPFLQIVVLFYYFK